MTSVPLWKANNSFFLFLVFHFVFAPKSSTEDEVPEIPVFIQAFETLRQSQLLNTLCSRAGFSATSFQEKMKIVASTMSWDTNTVLGDFLAPELDLPHSLTPAQASTVVRRLVLLAILLFDATGANDFFLLHAISASRATKKLLPLVESDEVRANILRQLWRGILVAYVCQGLPRIFPSQSDHLLRRGSSSSSTHHHDLTQTTEERWKKVVEQALGSREEHIIKVVYSLKEEEELFDHQQLPEDREAISKKLFLKTAEDMLHHSGQNGEGFTFNGAGYGGVD